MDPVTNDDFDFILLHMKKKFELKPGKKQKAIEDGFREHDFGMGFSVQIPGEFEQADEESASEIYWSEKRPLIILTTPERESGITFQFLNEEVTNETLSDCRKTVKHLIEQIDPRCVFYSMGETIESVWFDYKSFAKNEAVYNMVFLFQAGQRKILGTFFCIFKLYDRWKPVVLKILETIKPKEDIDERL